MFWGVLTHKLYFLLSRPPKGTFLRRNTRFEPSSVVIGPAVWSGHDAKSTKKKEPKVCRNSPFSQTPFASSHIKKILHSGSYPWYFFDFEFQKDLLKNVRAVRGRIFGFLIDLAHRLYNSLLLSYKPWCVYVSDFRTRKTRSWSLTCGWEW